MTMEYRQSLTELNTIIHYMDIEYLKKLPQKFIEFINSNMDKDYIPNIDKNHTLILLNLTEKCPYSPTQDCSKEINLTLIYDKPISFT